MKAENDTDIQSGNPTSFGSHVQDLEGGAEKRHRDLLALSRVSAAVSGLQDLDSILEVALDNVLSIMNGTIGGILLLDEQTQTLSYRVYRGLSAGFAEGMHLSLGEGIGGRVAQSGKSVLLEDISTDQRAARPDLVRTEGLKAFISVPLRAQEAVLGVINVASHMPHHFTRDDMYLLHSIGDQVGLAIEQAKLHERLRKGRERYRQLARQILIAQEEERRRISRELHDETSQTLTGLALNLQALADMAEMSSTQDDEFKAKLNKAHSLAIQVGTEISRLIRELRPALLDTLGLVPAIRQYAEANLGPLGMNVSVESKGRAGGLPPEVEVGVFRVTQGAIGNIAKHAQAKNVAIALECKANELLFCVSDDGKGFDVSEITKIEESGRGRGLFSMKERVGLLGGTCSVKSQPGQGTTVTARLPVIRSVVNAEDKGIGDG
jgi:signal transduction histidine kinase